MGVAGVGAAGSTDGMVGLGPGAAEGSTDMGVDAAVAAYRGNL